jgi:hypothetical protein
MRKLELWSEGPLCNATSIRDERSFGREVNQREYSDFRPTPSRQRREACFLETN